MLKDITIGQYFPGDSIVHKMDARVKIVLTLVYIVMLFCSTNQLGLLIGIVFLILAYGVSKIPGRMIIRSIKPIIPIVIFTAIINMFFLDGDVLFEFWIFTVTLQGVVNAVAMSVRVICLIAGTSLLTYTTSPIALTDGIERLCSPLKRVKVPVHELAMMMTIALRFIPTLIEETDKIMSAQKARGADLESGGIMQRARALIPILIPLFVSAFRRADELAMAMECRCYHGGEGRTRMRQMKIAPRDIFCTLFVLLCFAGVLLINRFAPAIIPAVV